MSTKAVSSTQGNSLFQTAIAPRHSKIHTLDNLPNGSITDKLAIIEGQLLSTRKMIANNAQKLPAVCSNLNGVEIQVQSAEAAQEKLNEEVRLLNEKVALTSQSLQSAKTGVWQAAQVVGQFLIKVPTMQTQPLTTNPQAPASTSQEGNNEARNVMLCGGHKVHRSDLERMQEQIQATERQLAAAEMNVRQAEEAYNAAWARAVDHVVPSVEVSCNPNVTVTVQGLGTYLASDGPNLEAARAIRNQAHTDYNYTLLKFGQEKALFGHMQRAYDKEHPVDVGVGWKGFFIGIFGGLFGFGVSKNF